MKEQKQFFNILTIIVNFLATLVFFVPSWYLSDTVVINDSSITLSNTLIRPFDHDLLNEVKEMYIKNGADLDLRLSVVFCVLILVTIALSACFAATTIFFIVKPNKITRRIQKIMSLVITTLCTSVLIIAIIFTDQSKVNFTDSSTTQHVYSLSITTGIYLFLTFEITGIFCSIIANKIPEQQEE